MNSEEYNFGDEDLLEHTFATACDNADAVIMAFLVNGHYQIATYCEDEESWILLLGLTLADLDQYSKDCQ